MKKIGWTIALCALVLVAGGFVFAENSPMPANFLIAHEHNHELDECAEDSAHFENDGVLLAEIRTCPVCKGDGKCSQCRGNGRCKSCNGSGYRERQHKHKCTSCTPSGSGKCSHCHGNGKCQNCSGRGTYTSRG